MNTKRHKLTAWPNGLGFDMDAGIGKYWELWGPNTSPVDEWRAGLFEHTNDRRVLTLIGSGATMIEAMNNARRPTAEELFIRGY